MGKTGGNDCSICLRITQILFKGPGNDRIRNNARYSNIGKMKYSDEIKTIKIIKSK